MSEKLFYVGVKGLIRNDKGEYLLLHADVTKFRKNISPYWDIPGGRIKEGDSVIETLQREILEETGITASSPEFLTAVVSNHEIPYGDDDKLAGLVLMVYSVQIPSDAKINISEEHTEYAWFSLADAKEKLAHKYPPEFIAQL
jgi:8-oxo-dGTP diphosphatase